MGQCECIIKSKYYKVDGGIVALDTYPYCENCGNGIIQIGQVTEDAHEVEGTRKMPSIENNPIQINLYNFRQAINEIIDDGFDDVYDNLDNEEREKYLSEEIFMRRIERKFKEYFMKRVKE